jgi:murein DD-endopeptidase MepM/ murein hydrolase activator NlpD
MRNKISFLVLSNSGSAARQFSASKLVLGITGGFFCLMLAGFGYVVYDYLNLKRDARQISSRATEVACRLESSHAEIEHQRKQIQSFAKEITTLKEKLLTLNEFESQIRIIANLDKSDEDENLFGIGGSIPEDLEANVPLKQKHNSLMREMHDQIDQIEMAAASQRSGFESLLKSLEDQQNLLASTPTIRPISPRADSWITSSFGKRISPFTKKKEMHKGYDIAANKGTPILSTADGVVTFVGNRGLYGKMVIVDHGHGIITRYGHCSKVLKKRGEKVSRWDTIALVGNTGRSTGPHVHYEVLLNGVPVNPEKYILN